MSDLFRQNIFIIIVYQKKKDTIIYIILEYQIIVFQIFFVLPPFP